jgi:hypothetical protein
MGDNHPAKGTPEERAWWRRLLRSERDVARARDARDRAREGRESGAGEGKR